jgi:hypothetical protein
MFRFRLPLITINFLLLVLLISACAAGEADTPTPAMEGMAMAEVPEDLDTSTTRMTNQGAFQVSVSSNLNPPDINEIHSWTIHLETPDGQAVENAQIAVDGGMPQHNHGFPTAPEVTEKLGGGDYLLEGVKFNMAGWWELKLAISAGDQTDDVTFNLVLP